MKLLFVNTTDVRGGAARAAQRIAGAVRDAGVEVEFLVKERTGPADGSILTDPIGNHIPMLAKIVDRAPVLAYPNGVSLFRSLNFSPAWRHADAADRINQVGADVVHLHWVNYGHMSPEGIARIRAPVVWTLHDMWPFTGGCHHAWGCEAFKARCGRCPILGSRTENDLSRRLLDRKLARLAERPPHVVAPSAWLADMARSSALFAPATVSLIPNPLDTRIYSPGDRRAARQRLGLPADARLVLFGATDALTNPYKGYPALKEALESLAVRDPAGCPQLAVFGADESQRGLAPDGVTTHLLGHLGDPSAVADAYRAADVFAAPSVQDNLPSTVAESLCCGTPVVAFAVGGMADMIVHGQTGWLVAAGDVAGLADALAHGVAAARSGDDLQKAARRSAQERYASERIAQAYIDIYRQALAAPRTPEKRT